MPRRQYLPQQVLEKKLSEAAAQFGCAENFLERCDIFSDVKNPPARLLQSTETLLHLADQLGGTVEALTEMMLALLHHLGVFPEPIADMIENLRQLALRARGAGVQRLAELTAQQLDLALHHGQGALLRIRPQQGAQPMQDKPS